MTIKLTKREAKNNLKDIKSTVRWALSQTLFVIEHYPKEDELRANAVNTAKELSEAWYELTGQQLEIDYDYTRPGIVGGRSQEGTV